VLEELKISKATLSLPISTGLRPIERNYGRLYFPDPSSSLSLCPSYEISLPLLLLQILISKAGPSFLSASSSNTYTTMGKTYVILGE
jgi:hypothetical protein